MQNYPIKVPAGETVAIHARGSFIRCRATTAEVKITGGRGVSLLMNTGDWNRLGQVLDQWDVTNTGAADVVATFTIGDGDAGSTGVTGDVNATTVQASALTGSAVAVGVAAGVLLAADPLRKAFRVANPSTNAASKWIGAAGVDATTGIEITPGSVWTEDNAAAAAWYVMDGIGGESVAVIEGK